jgi:hypothetical protein
MPDAQPGPVSITLSPAQVDGVVRAASQDRVPSIAVLVAGVLDPRAARSSLRPAAERLSVGGDGDAEALDRRLSRSLLRGLSLLRCLAAEGEAQGIVELAGRLGMSPSTAHRYALTLVELGLLERCPTTRKYRLPAA